MHCLSLFPLEQQNLLFQGTALSHGHILMLFTSFCLPYTPLIYCLFLGYFCFVAFKASFSFWIRIPHFGLFFPYIQGGLFLLSFRQYLSNIITSLDFSASALVCSTNVRDLPLIPHDTQWVKLLKNSGPKWSPWCPSATLAMELVCSVLPQGSVPRAGWCSSSESEGDARFYLHIVVV